jgi:hypothetical protein
MISPPLPFFSTRIRYLRVSGIGAGASLPPGASVTKLFTAVIYVPTKLECLSTFKVSHPQTLE